jgi:rhamnosyltransferase subunit B
MTSLRCPGEPRVVLATAGSLGDLNPFVGLARAIRSRGLRTTLLVPADHAGRAAAEGVEVVPLGAPGDLQAAIRDPQVWHPIRGFGRIWASGEAALRDALAWFDALPDDAPTTLVAHPLVLAHASIVRARRRSLRVLAAWLAPSNLVSVHDPLTLGPLAVPRWVPRAARRAAWWLTERVIVEPVALPRLNADRTGRELPPVRRLLSHLMSAADASVTLFPPWFSPTRPDWPRPLSEGAFVLHDPAAAGPLPHSVRAFLAAGEPPVVVTAGTAQVHAAAFFASALAAVRASGRRALLLSRDRAQVPEPLGADAMWHDYLPFAQLLPQSAALIHHGGIGTTAEALRAAVPQLVVPWAYDQFDNGARVIALGAGRASFLARRRPSRLAAELAALLRDARLRDGATAAAARIQADARAGRLEALVDAIVLRGRC